jgi:hypothetical protein
MKNSKSKIQNCRLLFCILHFAFCISLVSAQSTNQSYPTAVTTNEISGTIKARDLGDARLTSYFYAFNGDQGDVFINVVTKNLNGDIDIFTADGLRPLTKIVVYADASDSETGRVFYLRKPEKLIMRVQGRTPNDDPATFRIKFAGSFAALPQTEETEESLIPEVKSTTESDIRVNSVGTIIEVKPKPTPTPKQTAEKKVERAEKTTDEPKDVVKEITVETPTDKSVIAEANPAGQTETKVEIKEEPKQEETKKLEVVVTDNIAPKKEQIAENAEKEKPVEDAANDRTEVSKAVEETTVAKTPEKTSARSKNAKTKKEKSAEPDPLANIRLIILFKDGAKIERPMSEVLKVGVDKGVLTIISKNGSIGRYSILDIAKMTIE